MSHTDLHARQSHLLLRSAQLRTQVRGELAQLEPSFVLADRVVRAGRWLRRNPHYVAAALVVCAALKPRTAWRMAVWSWSLWQRWQKLRHQIAHAR